jgi:hypothetical protein
LDSDILETYVGDYEFKKLQMPVTIFKAGDTLFFRHAQETGALFSATETRFYGTSKTIGAFQANFIKGNKGEITNFNLQVGFGIWRFDKIKQ